MTSPPSSRRRFLASATGALAAVAVSRATGLAASSPARKMTIDLSCGPIGVKAGQVKANDLAARNGFESVYAWGGELAKMVAAELGELKAEMREQKIVFGAAGLSVDFRKDEETFSNGLEGLPAEAAGLERAGVTRVGTWLRPSHGELTYVQNFRQHARRLREVATILGDHGLRFGLEYVGPKTSWARRGHPFVHTMAETKDLLAEINVPTAGIVLDSWHWYTAHETVEDLLSLKNEQIIAVDLNDAPSGIAIDEQLDGKRELPATTGVIDVAAFLKALNQIGYDGPVRAEPFNAPLREMEDEDAVAATAAAMKKAFSAAGLL